MVGWEDESGALLLVVPPPLLPPVLLSENFQESLYDGVLMGIVVA